jgi:secreted trypsin-like serine protease
MLGVIKMKQSVFALVALAASGCKIELISQSATTANDPQSSEIPVATATPSTPSTPAAPTTDALIDEAYMGVVAIIRSGTHICNGAIIGNRTVITSATCASQITTANGTIRYGASQISSSASITVSTIQLHPTYVAAGAFFAQNDIAILVAGSTFNFSSRPAKKLKTAATTSLNATSTLAYSFGWRIQNAVSNLTDLRTLQFNVVSNGTVEAAWSKPAGNNFLGVSPREGACIVQSGSPLVSEGTGSAATLTGILTVANPTSCAQPPVYVKISAYASWIAASLPVNP